MSEYLATATVSRSTSACPCMQNFAIFKYGKNVYMIASSYSREKDRPETDIHLQLLKYDKTKKLFFFKTEKGEPQDSCHINIHYGHGNNIEVVKHTDGGYYCLYVEETEENKAKYVVCRKFTIIDNDTDPFTLKSEENYSRLTLFPDYKGTPINQCLLATSKTYICVTCSYGKTITTDTERYHIYEKENFLNLLAKSKPSKKYYYSQASLNSCRVATGMFTGSNSLGMNIPKNKPIIQSLALGENLDAKRVTIFGAIDNRTINKSDGKKIYGRKIHQINRACLNLKEAGSDAALKAQDPASVRCYYSPVNRLSHTDKDTGVEQKIYMNHKINGSYKKLTEAQILFELEGIKKSQI